MLELKHLDEEVVEFEQVYPRSLGYFMVFVTVSFAVWDVVMGVHAPRDVPRWGLWGLFVPMTVVLAAISAHLLRYRRTLTLRPREGTYAVSERGLLGTHRIAGRMEEVRHVLLARTGTETAEAWIVWKEERRGMDHLHAKVTDDPRTRLSSEFCEWLAVPGSQRPQSS